MSQQRELQIVNQWKCSIARITLETLNNPLITDPVVVSEIAKCLDRQRSAVAAEEARIKADYKEKK